MQANETHLPGFSPYDETRFPATRGQVIMEVKQAVRAWLDAWFDSDWEKLQELTDIYDDYPEPGGTLAGAIINTEEWEKRLKIHKGNSLAGFKINSLDPEGVLFPYLGALNIASVKVELRLALDNFLEEKYGKKEIRVTLYLKCQCRKILEGGELDAILSDKPWLSGGWRISLNSAFRILAAAMAAADSDKNDHPRTT